MTQYLNCMPARKNAPGTVGTGLHAGLDSGAEEPESFTALFFPGPPVLQFFNWIITLKSDGRNQLWCTVFVRKSVLDILKFSSLRVGLTEFISTN